MSSGLVFNIQKYSLHDGPGIRTTVFLKGCPLCCSWCHNPEGISPRRELIVVESRCTVCGECRRACPFAEKVCEAGARPLDRSAELRFGAAPSAVHQHADSEIGAPDPPGLITSLPVRHEHCTLCSECVEACPTGARQMVGREMSVAEVMDELLKDRIFYDDSDGGVTFSGGEPLLQPAFVKALLEACRVHGLHTAMDTCGFGCTDHLLTLAALADLVLYDLKFMDDARHRQHCGVPSRPILENLQTLSATHPRLWIRVPVIPGVNDDEENLSGIARFVSGLAGVQQVNLLPYHKTGAPKRVRLGQSDAHEDVAQPTAEQLEKALGIFRAFGLTARAGG